MWLNGIELIVYSAVKYVVVLYNIVIFIRSDEKLIFIECNVSAILWQF